MERRMQSPLTVGFDYTGPIADGDCMKISADRTVSRVTDPYDPYVGRVYSHDSGINRCVLVTPYIWHRDDRIAGVAGMGPGYAVIGPDNKAYPYTPAKPARHDGTAVGPTDITAGVNDAIKLKIQGGSSQALTLAPGEGRTYAAIAAEVNPSLTGMRLEVDADGNLNIVALELGKSVEVEEAANNAYAALGWTVGVYQPVNASHDPTCVKIVVLTSAASDGDQIETLEM